MVSAVISFIYNHLVGFFGTIVVGAAVIAFVAGLIERGRLSGKTAPGIAIITGASSGLGAAYARQIDANPEKFGVTAFWLIARNKKHLDALAAELKQPVTVLPFDLTTEADLNKLAQTISSAKKEDSGFAVSLLVNCAGFGKKGASEAVGGQTMAQMIAINDTAPVRIIDMTIPVMRPGSRIVNVCSVAGFQPIPQFNAYAASKAFLYSYSRALRVELLPKKISVTAVCPYWIADTAFIGGAYGKPKKLFMSSKVTNVAHRSLSAARKRHALSTPGFVTALDRIFAGLIPDGVLTYIMMWFL